MPDLEEVKRIQEHERAQKKLTEQRAKEIVLEELEKLKRAQKQPGYILPHLRKSKD